MAASCSTVGRLTQKFVSAQDLVVSTSCAFRAGTGRICLAGIRSTVGDGSTVGVLTGIGGWIGRDLSVATGGTDWNTGVGGIAVSAVGFLAGLVLAGRAIRGRFKIGGTLDTIFVARGGIGIAPLAVVNSTGSGKTDVVLQSVAYLTVGTGDNGVGCGQIRSLG